MRAVATDVLYVTQAGKLVLEAEVACLHHLRGEVLEEQHRSVQRWGPQARGAVRARAEVEAIDREVRRLQAALKLAVFLPDHDRRVAVGSRVVLGDDGGRRCALAIVGPAAANPRQGLVSYESALGQALLGKQVGDSAQIMCSGMNWRGRVLEVGVIAHAASH